ncbi:NAD(P)H-dependent amine dehydrogenase family protein [Mycobacteroides abscessus]|uniref:NAD(P)H-dependent amine dehydrogenase family protein n=1 Tax=Mycobacteroides abscessus TaxID=36809 RepID=UPI0003051B35|nr:dihydrodipicolinate reductase [Mycobacteroides abscessus]SHT49127.1 dihydrodipicolinate reductase N-terminus domain-containing protein [Mycobacteroides abscessus subsp. bolletii]SHW42465.1 dihydrodipicolinate reductase N-terminus domain-containing protein [Mycobacteroides abscessus subsp. bolletii]SHW78771.1 dihydrodipicolinate reductase N-terminus domain-containing protein [Mycobacteroides abscessus subsp. bolletii]SHX03283.1 dihydrodipicolinate reductase N-terminus domain-containing protei
MIKVGVWGPGSMGVIALRAVIDHPDLVLTSVVVHSEAKIGRDAGELCGTERVGIVATADAESLIQGDADVVVYAAAANVRPLEAIADMAALLRAGKNVVSCSVVPMVYPEAVDAALTRPLADAASAGGSSFFTTGIDTGFANDVLPLVLSGVSRTIHSVRVTEMFNYATYPEKGAVYEILGFGKPPEFEAFAATEGVFTFGWGPVVHQLAHGLGCEVERLEERVERLVVGESFHTPTGYIEAGTVGAMRSTLTGHIDGGRTIVVDHVSRMHDDLAPHWPQPRISMAPRDLGYGGASGQGVYRVEIKGSPDILCELELAEDHDHDLGARIAGAAHMVNAIPAVYAAKPGLLSALNLPVITGLGLMAVEPGLSPDSRLVGGVR